MGKDFLFGFSRAALFGLDILLSAFPATAQDKNAAIQLNIQPPHIKTDPNVRYDYDIVYVRGARRTDGKEARWAEFSKSNMMEHRG